MSTSHLSPKMQEMLAKAKAAAEAHKIKQAEREAAAALAKQKSSEERQAAVVSGEFKLKQTIASAVYTGAGFRPIIAGMQYNEFQLEAIEYGMRGKSYCMIGAAGTGKTTTTREVISQLMRLPHISMFDSSTKYLQRGTPGVLIVSFTNKAVNNIKKQLPKELQDHCLTLHKLLEFEPIRDAENKIIGFGPSRTRDKTLPYISCVFFEESSMIGTDLYALYRAALPVGCHPQEIFLGDLNQVPPVFGPSILGFKLVELPTVELLHVYRQALLSPIISLAHRVREGKSFNWEVEDGRVVKDEGEHGRVEVRFWKKRMNDLAGVKTMGAVLLSYMDAGNYNPEEDIVLCPFNVKFGTLELNKIIAQRLTKDRNEVTHEVIARGKESYWAVGDKVLFEQMDARIVDIRPAPGYTGRFPRKEDLSLRRDGTYADGQKHGAMDAPKTDFDLLDDLESTAMGSVRDTNSASHILKLEFTDSGLMREISASGDINKLLLGYVITVHKSQGSEWRRVFVALHYTHNVMITRELIYTAFTRARHELTVFADPGKEGSMDSITKAARTPEIKGITLAEKAEYFKGKSKEYQSLLD